MRAEVAVWRAHLAAISPDADPAEADWWDTDWPPGTPAAVGFLVPRGFEAYARVLHPAHDHERDAVTWATVAEEAGTTLHPQAQWHRLSGGREYDPRGEGAEPRRWPGNEPRVGVLERPQMEALADVLARHTTSPARSIVGFWVGYGVWPVAWHAEPTAPGPGRESYLFERPVSEVVTLCAEAPAVAYALGTPTGTSMVIGGPPPTVDEEFELWAPHQWQSPSAWWPADRAWATSNDTDLDSTLVGGTRALVDDLLADERLEVLPWPVDGSLWSNADTINV